MDVQKSIINLDERLLESDTFYGKEYDNLTEATQELKDSIKKNTYFTGLCTKCDADGVLTVIVNGVTCLMERNEVSVPNDEDGLVHKGICQKKVGTYIKAKVIRIENETQENEETIYLSRRELIKEVRDYYDANLIEGTIVNGKVINIDETKGVFVDIGGDIIGIIPRNLLENLFVTNLSNHVSIGEKIKAIVFELKKNKAGNIVHLALDRKSLLPKFNKLAKNYKKGDTVLAKVKSIRENGIYCSLDKHLDIICDFDNQRYRTDQNVRVRINSVKYDKQRITGTILEKIL
ncbi:S1 RNA-binding domain-containing protein (plasmid) [Clostridium beijerinckii]|uniref:S1 RNA-binding domain-containing protein n=1 Tax=Clostridium beijerinckii TaxID=1520 RepID=UPI002226ADEE|nr:S1 RNA-binding domain-containing protein [Clostridium beijerinckii]UYZ38966.1 S1 RNA-binding domain-containing protein [Clostridium beijerinckii]